MSLRKPVRPTEVIRSQNYINQATQLGSFILETRWSADLETMWGVKREICFPSHKQRYAPGSPGSPYVINLLNVDDIVVTSSGGLVSKENWNRYLNSIGTLHNQQWP